MVIQYRGVSYIRESSAMYYSWIIRKQKDKCQMQVRNRRTLMIIMRCLFTSLERTKPSVCNPHLRQTTNILPKLVYRYKWFHFGNRSRTVFISSSKENQNRFHQFLRSKEKVKIRFALKREHVNFLVFSQSGQFFVISDMIISIKSSNSFL